MIGNTDFSGTTLLVSTTDNSTSQAIIVGENTTVSYDYEIKNYRIEPQFIPNPKIRGKYKRNLKYK